MEKKLANVQEAIYSLVAPCELLTVTSRTPGMDGDLIFLFLKKIKQFFFEELTF
jgi:hypothetical protein